MPPVSPPPDALVHRVSRVQDPFIQPSTLLAREMEEILGRFEMSMREIADSDSWHIDYLLAWNSAGCPPWIQMESSHARPVRRVDLRLGQIDTQNRSVTFVPSWLLDLHNNM